MTQKKILIIDDSKAILEGMKMFLQMKDYEVLTDTSAKNLSETLASFHPDILILDIFLTHSDGRELCRNIKNNSATDKVKIILSSAAPSALDSFEDCGADGILAKPFGLQEIYKLIAELI